MTERNESENEIRNVKNKAGVENENHFLKEC